MTNNERKIMFNITDMLQGEINRMCVTDSLLELDSMASYAHRNIEKLRSLRFDTDFSAESGNANEPE